MTEPKTPREKMDAIDPVQFNREMYNEWVAPEPKTPQELNEAVAKRLGFDSLKDAESAWYDHNRTGITGLDFTDDPAAAVWALERYCFDNDCIAASTRFDQQSWTCSIVGAANKTIGRGMGTFEEAICWAIAGAAG